MYMICLPLKSGLKHLRKENKRCCELKGEWRTALEKDYALPVPLRVQSFDLYIIHTVPLPSEPPIPSLTDSHFRVIPVHGPWQNAWHCDICIVYSKCLKHLSTSTWSCSLRSLFVQILSVVERAAICIERCTGAVHGADKLGQPGVVLGAENNADTSVTINVYVYCILCIVAV